MESSSSSVRQSKAGYKRVKSTRACDRCKKKKAKCSGEQPCDRCNNNEKDCAYISEYTRGREPIIQLRPSSQVQEQAERKIQSDDKYFLMLNSVSSDIPSYSSTRKENHEDLDSQEFVSSNGGSVFERTQKGLQEKDFRHQNSSIFMFGDPPLPEFDGSFSFLPPLEIAKNIVSKYFDIAGATIRLLHRPTVDLWMETYSIDFLRDSSEESSVRATLLMILATGQDHMDSVLEDEDLDCSIQYFQAASYQLRKETGHIRLTSIQARLLQCYYLASRSRINQCWTIFGTVVNLSIALGIHRKEGYRLREETSVVDVECRRRTFWAAYNLDKYLSFTMGRPPMFQDEYIDQDLPLSVNDNDLEIASITTSYDKLDPTMEGTIRQIKLSIIMGNLHKDLYSLRPLETNTRLALTDKHLNELAKWRQEVSNSFGFEFRFSLPIISRNPLIRYQGVALMLTYHHVLILLYRPFLLDIFSNVPSERNRMREHMKGCLDACMIITDIVGLLYRKGPSFRPLWFCHYSGYSAVVCLYVYVIRAYEQPPETWKRYLEAAQECQQQINASAGRESFAERCSSVLEKLEADTLACIHRKDSYSQDVPGLVGVDGIQSFTTNTLIDRIDRWGFSSLTGY